MGDAAWAPRRTAVARRADPGRVRPLHGEARYIEKHGQYTAGAGVQRRNLFLAGERVQEGATVTEFTLDA